MLAYLRRVIATGTEESSRRFSLVGAALTFSAGILLLCAGAMVGLALGHDTSGLAAALWPLCLSYGALAGVAYVGGPARAVPSAIPPPTPAPENVASARPDGAAP